MKHEISDSRKMAVGIAASGCKLTEPQGNLGGGGLIAIRAVAQVAADIDGEVEADGAGGGVGGLGGAQQLATDGEGVLALPHHAHDGAGRHVGDQAGEEGLGGQVLVVLLQQSLGGRHHLQGNQLQALALEAGDDLANQAALDACINGSNIKVWE